MQDESFSDKSVCLLHLIFLLSVIVLALSAVPQAHLDLGLKLAILLVLRTIEAFFLQQS